MEFKQPMFHLRLKSKYETRYRCISLLGVITLTSQLPDPSVLQPPDELHLARRQKEQRGACCAHPGRATNSVDIISGSGRSCKLHYPVHMGQVQAPGCHVLQRERHYSPFAVNSTQSALRYAPVRIGTQHRLHAVIT